MSVEPVVVVGVGMMTAVGLTAAETAASVRSATSRFNESALHDARFDPFTLAEVPEDGLPEVAEGLDDAVGLTARELRMLRLATMPLRECLTPISGAAMRPGLCIALPETETTTPLGRAAFVRHLAVQVPGAFEPRAADASHVGRAGGLIAVGQAVSTIQSGRSEFMIAGAVDTYRDLYVLGTLDLEQRVKSDAAWDGFIPGEGAAFLLLASAIAARARGLTPLARVTPVAVGFEPGHLYSEEPYRGDGLAATLQQLVAQGAVEAPIVEVYSSMTGEGHWAKEWGVGYVRNKDAFQPVYRMHHPADCYGETGAACGPLMVALAAIGIAGGYRRSPSLIYGSSDRGGRAALIVSA